MSPCQPRLRSTCSALVLSDFLALAVSLALSYGAREVSGGHLPFDVYLGLMPFFLLFLLLYSLLGLYPGVLQPPSEELKRLSLGSSTGFLFLSLLLFLGQQGVTFSRFVILFAWCLSLLMLPLFRYLTRRRFRTKTWWGYPVLVFSPKEDRSGAMREVFSRQGRGLFIAGTAAVTLEGGLCLFGTQSEQDGLKSLRQRYPGALACIVADDLSHEALQALIIKLSGHFSRIVIHMNTPWLKQASLRVAAFPCGPVLTMRQNLLDPTRRRVKRLLDILLCLAGSGVLIVLIPLIALYIRLDSKGPIFFRQRRIGLNGKTIYVLKFRTMVDNAAQALKEALDKDPVLREEWAKNRKLVKDPRLTRAGTFLRRISLDELPQVFNVIKGEMSLVGPRPIVEKEISRYGDAFELYKRVKPGITGLWQVSGRNDLSYPERVELDRHYVYNWSIWLDIYIIIRTFPTVLSGRGAY